MDHPSLRATIRCAPRGCPCPAPMRIPLRKLPFFRVLLAVAVQGLAAVAQENPFPFQALSIPKPGSTNATEPYAPQAILQGGIVVPLYPPDSPQLKQDRIREAEAYNMSRSVPGRINSITNIHNPSIEVHLVDGSFNTGAAIILAAGGGHRTLNVGSESADLVPWFYNYGVNTVILRNRLRADGYNVQSNAVVDAFNAIRIVRARASEWKIDPKKIGIMGFSAGAELAAPTALFHEDFDNHHREGPWGAVSSRPDFVVLVYPGPTPFARGANPPVPIDAPPSFIMCAGSGDRIHAIWATEYFSAMLQAAIPNLEMHIYGNGRHPGEQTSDGTRMAAGLADRNGIPIGKWQDRFIDWFRDLGFLQKQGVETKAERDSSAFQSAGGRNRERR